MALGELRSHWKGKFGVGEIRGKFGEIREIRCQFIFSEIRCQFIFSGASSDARKFGVSSSFRGPRQMRRLVPHVRAYIGLARERESKISASYQFTKRSRCQADHRTGTEAPCFASPRHRTYGKDELTPNSADTEFRRIPPMIASCCRIVALPPLVQLPSRWGR